MKAVVVDLDGTFIARNSFQEFYKAAILHAAALADISLFVRLLRNFICRKFRRISHAELKRRTLALYCGAESSALIQAFSKKMCGWVDVEVVNRLREYSRRGYGIILSTAAPWLYVEPFLSRQDIEFAGVVATKAPCAEGWQENVGEAKARETCKYLRSKGWSLDILMTDHHDDLPLLAIPKELNVLVRPTKLTEERVRCMGIPVEILR